MKRTPMNNPITSTENAEHYTWGNQCDGWHLLRSGSLSVIQERMPPGTSEQMHYHESAQQVFYILSGTATFEVEGGLKTVNGGQSDPISTPNTAEEAPDTKQWQRKPAFFSDFGAEGTWR